MTRRLLSRGLKALSFLSLTVPVRASAQTYCTPANTQGVPYFFAFNFGSPGNNGVTNGQSYSNNNSTYTNNASSGSAGTLLRYFSTGLHYAVYNPSNTVTYGSAQINTYVDWNNDGDFNDANEAQFTKNANLTPLLSFNDYAYISAPINTPTGNYRMRYVVSQNSAPSACGAFTGETEDFTISIGSNNAPVLNTAKVPFLNPMLSSQTNTNGFSLDLLTKDSVGNYIITDADDNGTSRVPRGIAITGQTASNGTWQYKVGNGAWTAFGTVSTMNALLLTTGGMTAGDPSTSVRIRFVPSGAGTPSFTYRAWDYTTGTNGGYADASTTGSTTAFSALSQTVGTTVYSSMGSSPLGVYVLSYDTALRNSSYNRSTGDIVQPDKLTNATAQQKGFEVRVDAGTGNLFWTDGSDIYSSAADGSSQAQPVSGVSGSVTGIAAGGGNLYYSLYTSQGELYRSTASGTGAISLMDGPGQLQSADLGYIDKIYYYNNRLYGFSYTTDYNTAYLISMATDGTNVDTISTLAGFPANLHVVNDTVFWTESDASNYYMKRIAANGSGATTTFATDPHYMFNGIVADPANHRALTLSGSQVLEIDMSTGAVAKVLVLDGNLSALVANVPSTAVVLPIDILSWNAQAVGRAAKLHWTVASEEAGVRYEVERSADGNSFHKLQEIKGTRAGQYQVYDEHPLPGANYYRLSVTELSGKRSLSDVRKVVFNDQEAVAVFPNPASEEGFTVKLPSATAFPQPYTLTDLKGQVIGSGNLRSALSHLSTTSIAPGHYVLHVLDGSYMLIRN